MSETRITIARSLAALVCAAFLQAANNDEFAVKQAEMSWGDATLKGDAAALGKLLGDDLTYTHSSGRTETKKEFIEALQSGAMKYVSIVEENMAVRVYGDTGILTATAKMQVVSRGQPNSFQVRLLHVWVKRGGGWQMVAHQTTRIP